MKIASENSVLPDLTSRHPVCDLDTLVPNVCKRIELLNDTSKHLYEDITRLK